MTRLIATCLLLATGACHISAESKDRDAGPETDRRYDVAQFDRIQVAGPYDVKVTTGGAPGVTAKGGADLLDETDVTVEGGKLIIAPKKQKGIRWNWRNGKATFAVSTTSLKAARIAGSGDIAIDKVGGAFAGNVDGSGNLSLAQVAGGTVSLAITGSGSIRASGQSDSTDLSIKGSGDIATEKLMAKTAEVSIAGSGNVRANATETSKVSIMGSGDVDIGGGGKCSVSKAGSGDVNCH